MSTAATAAAAPAPMPPAALTRPGTAPPMATLWAVAKRLPATTLPIPACIPAAIVPNSSNRLDGHLDLAWGKELTSDGPGSAETNNAQQNWGNERRQDDTCSGASGGEGDSRQN